MPEHEPAYFRLFELADRWGCRPADAIDDLCHHPLRVCVHATRWELEWGTWHRYGNRLDGTSDVMPDPIAFGEPGHLDESVEDGLKRRGGARWVRHLSPRQVNGTVALFRRDILRLLEQVQQAIADGREPDEQQIAFDEVDGTPLQIDHCGRLVGGPRRVRFDGCFVLREDLFAFEQRHGLAPHASPLGSVRSATAHKVLLEMILDADHPAHAPELAMAVQGWTALFHEGGYDRLGGQTAKQALVSWLAQRGVKPKTAASERISSVANPYPSPGRPLKPRKG